MDRRFFCIVCDKEQEQVSDFPQTYGATMFSTSGHYGSTVFDPMDGTQLEIVVCDKCLRERNYRVSKVTSYQPNAVERFSPWSVDE